MRLRVTFLVWLTAVLPAQDRTTAVSVTATGRTMVAALDGALGGGGAGAAAPRTVVLLLDPSAELRKAGFGAELAAGLARNAARMAKTRLGLAVVGRKDALVVPPGRDFKAVQSAVAQALVGAQDQVRNVYASIRATLPAFAKAEGDRELVLIALQNGDAEDDLEATVRSLRRAEVRFKCITAEVYLADSYWTARPYAPRPKKTVLTGGDAAFVELPWGWILQGTVTNEIAPSGYATYGLSRLAAATDGAVHLYAAPSSSRHQCAIVGQCLFCDGDHAPSVDTFWRARLAQLAPSTADRATVLREAGGDPWFRAMLKAWQAGNKAGLIRGTPGVRLTGNGLAPQRARVRPTFSISSTNPKSQAKRALRAAAQCERILARFSKELAGIDKNKGIPRYRAMARFTEVMLRLTKVNLVTFAGWCNEIAPGLLAKQATTVVPPQVPENDAGRRPAGIGFNMLCLCHGVGPFHAVELPGGADLRAELGKLQTLGDAFEALHGHTPLGFALHKSGIARFHLTYPGKLAKGPRRRPKSNLDKGPVTERGRPTRPGRSSGGAAGPTTGRE